MSFHMAKLCLIKMNIEKPIFWTDLKIDFERCFTSIMIFSFWNKNHV